MSSGNSPALKDIEAAREWEQCITREGGEMVVSAAALVKAASLVLVLVLEV